MSKPKEYRVCAFCGNKRHKSIFLRITVPNIQFDFWQNFQNRAFYVCQNNVCIDKVFKKKVVYKHLSSNVDISLLASKLKDNIKCSIIYNIDDLFNRYGLNLYGEYNEDYLVLCRYDIDINCSNKILLDKNIYSGNKEACIIYNKVIADKLIKYKNLITNIEGLFYGELNGSKKS